LDREDCSSFLENLIHDESASIIGKWKLERRLPGRGGVCKDYSQCNVVYEFKSNGVLTISGQSAELVSPGRIGNHCYSIIDIIWPSGLPDVWITYPGIKMGDQRYQLILCSNKLVMSQAPHDGPTYYFIRTKQNNID
jgi:hypothetical protein